MSDSSENTFKKILDYIKTNNALLPRESKNLLQHASNLGISVRWKYLRRTRLDDTRETSNEQSSEKSDSLVIVDKLNNKELTLISLSLLNEDDTNKILNWHLNSSNEFGSPNATSTPFNSPQNTDTSEQENVVNKETTENQVLPEFEVFQEVVFPPLKMDASTYCNLDFDAVTMKLNPGKFYGNGNDDVNDFVCRFERACKVNGWTEDKDKARYVPCFLAGPAYLWLENFEAEFALKNEQKDPKDEMTYELLKTGLTSEFEPKTPVDIAEFKLRNRVQESGESVESYYQSVLRLCRIVNPKMEEEDKIRHLLHGLDKKLTKDVALATNKTAADVLANARRVEKAISYSTITADENAETEARKQNTEVMNKVMEKLNDLSVNAKPNQFFQQNRGTNRPPYYQNYPRNYGSRGHRGSGNNFNRYNGQTGRFYNHGRNTERPRFNNSQQNYRDQPSTSQNQYTRNNYRNHGTRQGSGNVDDITRTSDGRVICFRCKAPGHYATSCTKNLQHQ